MPCILRVSSTGLHASWSRLVLKPYRLDGGTGHFDVSAAEFDDLPTQVSDALAFLRTHEAEVKQLMAADGANGVLDFAVSTEAGFQFKRFPIELVRAAAGLGLALELSQYPPAGGVDTSSSSQRMGNPVDSRYGSRGLVASLHTLPDGRIRVRLDDAQFEGAADTPHWLPVQLFTYRDIDAAKLGAMTVSEQELADIGLNVLARLVAVTGVQGR